MKKIVSIILLALSTNAFTQITLNETNMPFGVQPYTIINASISGANAPTTGLNQTWNYSSLGTAGVFNRNFVTPQSASITGATFADTSLLTDFISNTNYLSDNYYAEDANAIKILGTVTKKQGYNIASMTGGANDSCKFANQFFIFNNPYKIIEYPATMSSKWTNSFTERVDFVLNIPGYFVFNTPCYRVSHNTVIDTVVGWGEMTVPTLLGASVPYEVLMVKRNFIAADSFYVNNSPAPQMLLSALSLSQGQQRIDNRYVFWRENASIPLIEFKFGNNNFTNPTQIFIDGQASVGINKANLTNSEISIYPNPASDILYVKGINKSDVEIYDLTGKIIFSQSNINNAISINLDNFNNGNYIVRIISNNQVINKRISVIK